VVAHCLQTQAEFTFAAGMRARTAGRIGVRTHQQTVTAWWFAMAQSFEPPQSGQDVSRSGMVASSGEEAWPVDAASAPRCGSGQLISYHTHF
jgi:hypothetical protein